MHSTGLALVELGALFFEDLAMAVCLPILTTLLAGVSLLGGLSAVGVALVAITVVLVVALRYGRVVSAVIDSPVPEVFLLRVLGVALLVAGGGSPPGVSP